MNEYSPVGHGKIGEMACSRLRGLSEASCRTAGAAGSVAVYVCLSVSLSLTHTCTTPLYRPPAGPTMPSGVSVSSAFVSSLGSSVMRVPAGGQALARLLLLVTDMQKR